MWYSNIFLRLYTQVLENHSLANGVTEEDVQKAIEDMHKIYQGSPDSLSKNSSCLADFNKVVYRCAYLHKYAAFHAALAYETMSRALTENSVALTLDSFHLFRSPLKICSLGGGPGTDVIGILSALHDKFGFFPTSAVVVDIMAEWKSTLSSVIQELRLRKGNYGTLSQSVSDELFRCSFLAADIQSKMSGHLNKAIGSADLITMVKFVSATASTKTSDMIEKIFRVIKPGALVLFVDNAAGGFQQLISNAAAKYAFIPVFGPLNHELYVNETFNQIKFGYKSCYETRVAVQLLMKSSKKKHLTKTEVYSPLFCNSLSEQKFECEKGNIKKTLIECDNTTETKILKPLSLDENTLSTNSLPVQHLECEKGNIKKTLIEFDNSTETVISKPLSLDENTLSTYSLPVQQLECEKGNTKKTVVEFDNSTETEIAKPLSLDENTLPKIQLQFEEENGKKPLLELDDSELKRKSVKRKALLPEPLSNSPLYFKRTLKQKRRRLNLSYEDQMSPDASLISPNRFVWDTPLCNSSQSYEDSLESLNTYFNNSNQFFYDMPPRNSPQHFEFSPYHTRPRMLFSTPNQWSPYLPFTNVPSHQNQSFNSEKCNLCGCVHLGLCY
ncbi:uncharacterized protein CDAR_420781 [Caerostris darwini]|uniref:Uncharacterized protein n=1 Tax=Caerostris darwini TaxID=1538125 RepID=A0AAV4QYC7_9ARAC|nr:uncharacterized protein CDAR_420781 [Caerostris darwini]